MTSISQRIVASLSFHTTIIVVILMVGVLAGLETDAAIVAKRDVSDKDSVARQTNKGID